MPENLLSRSILGLVLGPRDPKEPVREPEAAGNGLGGAGWRWVT